MVDNKHLDKPTEERWGLRRTGKLTTIVNGLGNVDLMRKVDLNKCLPVEQNVIAGNRWKRNPQSRSRIDWDQVEGSESNMT